MPPGDRYEGTEVKGDGRSKCQGHHLISVRHIRKGALKRQRIRLL